MFRFEPDARQGVCYDPLRFPPCLEVRATLRQGIQADSSFHVSLNTVSFETAPGAVTLKGATKGDYVRSFLKALEKFDDSKGAKDMIKSLEDIIQRPDFRKASDLDTVACALVAVFSAALVAVFTFSQIRFWWLARSW